jgi:glutathione synthase/RimK-type ligase-like ATP-grasp enzyme
MVCLVTCLRWPVVSASDLLLQRALEQRGVRVTARPWNAPDASFDGFDAVVLRSNWDYHFELDAFAAWLDRWERAGARIWNPPALVRWNLTKQYLIDLAADGIDVVPTTRLSSPADLPALLTARGWTRAVVKPLVSASAHDTMLVEPGGVAAAMTALAEGRVRQPVIVQPFVEDIRTRGEWSLILVEGALTHAVLKSPAAGDFRVQAAFGGVSATAPAPERALAAARRIFARLPAPALYARIDGVETRDGFLLMEVEVNEPGLFLNLAPDAAERLAEAVVLRLAG